MSEFNLNTPASRASGQTLPIPVTRTNLEFVGSYTNEEFLCIKHGLISKSMEDKWLIFFEEPWLYFHRSWTGACIYGLRFLLSTDAAIVAESWVSRETREYQGTQIEYERALLKFIIDALLLKKPASFPIPGGLPSNVPKGVFQHSLVGRGYPEVVRAEGALAKQSWWTRLIGKIAGS